MIRLAKLVLWVLQNDCVASAWRPCDNYVCGAVAISAGKKKTEKKQKIGRNRNKYVHKHDEYCYILTLLSCQLTHIAVG
jgi:hypothetical protein